jgi:SDR family mycofactocin-dependent oxidoreductase
MKERLAGKVVLVTGAARGQGRSHALRLASEGADVIAFDIAASPAACLEYPPASADDLRQTESGIADLGRRVVATEVDTRDLDAFVDALDEAVAKLGGLNVVVANAGVVTYAPLLEITPEQWEANIGVNLTGTWHTVRAAVPHLLKSGPGGSIVMTGSVCASRALPFLVPYNASKHGVLGLARSFALELGPHGLRVNTVNPAGVNTPMSGPDVIAKMGEMVEEHPGIDFIPGVLAPPTETGACEPEDISDTVAFLASDEARYITGQDIYVDFGRLVV